VREIKTGIAGASRTNGGNPAVTMGGESVENDWVEGFDSYTIDSILRRYFKDYRSLFLTKQTRDTA
jgi:hypothetical protein